MTQIRNSSFGISLFSLLLGACGGSSGDGSDISRSPIDDPRNGINSPSENFDYKPGEYEPRALFADYCINPDVSRGERQGIAEDENNFLRSWTNETYLWNEDVPDLDPGNYANPLQYFDLLVTDERDVDGNLLDQFHFSIDTETYETEIVAGISVDYGISWDFASLTPPRSATVRYVEPGSPADEAGIVRGLSLESVGTLQGPPVNFANSDNTDLLNAALFPEEGAEAYQFRFAEQDDAVVMQAEQIISSPVLKSEVLTIPATDTRAESTAGYLVFNDHAFRSEFQLLEALESFEEAEVDDLILDLRYNGGGLLYIASQLAYMIAGDQTDDKAFSTMVVNDNLNNTDPSSGRPIEPTPFFDEYFGLDNDITAAQRQRIGDELPTLNLSRVYVISTDDTCSASEAIISGLIGIDVEVVLIGGTTCGKPYGFYPTENCGTTYFSIQFQGVNDKGFGDFAAGFKPGNFSIGQESSAFPATLPGCQADDDLANALGSLNEASLAAAVNFIQTDSCPAPAAMAAFSLKSKPAARSTNLQHSGKALEIPKRRIPGAIAVPVK